MKKILISIKKNYIYFAYKNRTSSSEEALLNTNVISDNELLFSEEYIEKNPKIVSLFLKELCAQYDIHIIAFQRNEMFNLLYKLFVKNPNIRVLYLFEEVSLTYNICEQLIKSNYIKQLNCYNVPNFMIELLDKYGIEVTSRNEMLFTSTFMEENNLNQFSKIFYKISIKLNLPMSDKDFEDFESFCKINKYLRTIHIEKVNLDDIEKVLKILKDCRITRIRILIHDNINDEETILSLKKLNKISKRNKISFSLVYSDDYLKSNVINQTMVSILKLCGSIIACLILTVVGYIVYSNYDSMNKDAELKEKISAVIDEADDKQSVDEPSVPDENQPEDETPVEEQNNNNNNNQNKSINNSSLTSLLSVNEDTVGWLKVPNTNIDYPVVQASDNDYYLKKNFYKEKDSAGWIFMDFRDNPTDLSKNTIMYGHNRFSSGVMFGTLQKTLNKSWYTDSANQYITFNTLYANMKWKIFSIYKINVTTDYLVTSFNTDEEWASFIKLLTDRSIYNFNTPVGSDDKIISLSTCMGSNSQQRLVVHAVLVK